MTLNDLEAVELRIVFNPDKVGYPKLSPNAWMNDNDSYPPEEKLADHLANWVGFGFFTKVEGDILRVFALPEVSTGEIIREVENCGVSVRGLIGRRPLSPAEREIAKPAFDFE